MKVIIRVSIFFIFFIVINKGLAQEGSKLIEAIMYQEFDKAKELVKNGVDVNYQDESSGSTALILACQYGFVDMATFLIDNNAELDLQEDNGKTALMVSAGASEELFNLLLSKEANPNIKTNDGTTALTQACIGILMEKVSLEVVQTLINKGANVDEAPTSGRAEGYTCLMTAARNDQPELVKILIKNGADVNKMAKDGNTALSLAEKEEDQEMITLLKKLGAEK